jgi:fido (protein-threonine AMPylation protein)
VVAKSDLSSGLSGGPICISPKNLKKSSEIQTFDDRLIHKSTQKLNRFNAISSQLLVPEALLIFALQRDFVVNRKQFTRDESVEQKVVYDEHRLQCCLKTIIEGNPRLQNQKNLDLPFLQAVHRVLVGGASRSNGLDAPGEFRSRSVWLGSLGVSRDQAHVIPLEPMFFQDYLGDLIDFTKDSRIDPLFRIAFFYFQLIAIHPFGNGNGRTARTMITLLGHHLGLTSAPTLWIAQTLDASRSLQFAAFRKVFIEGSHAPWISYFAKALDSNLDELIPVCESLLEAQHQMLHVVSSLPPNLRPVARQITSAFFCQPHWAPSGLAEYIGLPQTIIDSALRAFKRAGLCTQSSGDSITAEPLQRILFNPSRLGAFETVDHHLEA